MTIFTSLFGYDNSLTPGTVGNLSANNSLTNGTVGNGPLHRPWRPPKLEQQPISQTEKLEPYWYLGVDVSLPGGLPAFMPEGFSVYKAEVAVRDYFKGGQLIMKTGTHWWGQGKYAVRFSEDPVVLFTFLRCQGEEETFVWFHHFSDTKKWQTVPPLNAPVPWTVTEFVHHFTPTKDYPQDWARPTAWDLIAEEDQ